MPCMGTNPGGSLIPSLEDGVVTCSWAVLLQRQNPAMPPAQHRQVPLALLREPHMGTGLHQLVAGGTL